MKFDGGGEGSSTRSSSTYMRNYGGAATIPSPPAKYTGSISFIAFCIHNVCKGTAPYVLVSLATCDVLTSSCFFFFISHNTFASDYWVYQESFYVTFQHLATVEAISL